MVGRKLIKVFVAAFIAFAFLLSLVLVFFLFTGSSANSSKSDHTLSSKSRNKYTYSRTNNRGIVKLHRKLSKVEDYKSLATSEGRIRSYIFGIGKKKGSEVEIEEDESKIIIEEGQSLFQCFGYCECKEKLSNKMFVVRNGLWVAFHAFSTEDAKPKGLDWFKEICENRLNTEERAKCDLEAGVVTNLSKGCEYYEDDLVGE